MYSWDRQMFLVHQPDDNGTPSQYPQFTTIEKNLMIANYNSQEAVDNDDGSGFFHTENNVLVCTSTCNLAVACDRSV